MTHHPAFILASSSTRLYGSSYYYDNDHDDDEQDNEDNEDEQDEYYNEEHENQQQMEHFRQSLESLFAIPNDNQSSKKKKKTFSKKSFSVVLDTASTVTPASIPTTVSNNNVNENTSAIDNHENENNNNSSNNNSKENNSSSSNNNNNNNNKNNDEQLSETLTEIRDITTKIVANSSSSLPLTAVGRQRRLKEISLLSSLSQSDDAINDLWTLWISEKGPIAATLLLKSEQLLHVESYDEAESILWSIIHEYGIHWAEPINRLATLKYMQGKYEESKKLCELVLQIKPWHFGALRGLVLICTASNDASGARYWSERCCPNALGNSERRTLWVNEALDAASNRLRDAAQVGREPIGKEEMEFRTFRTQLQHLNMEVDKNNNNNNKSSSSSNINYNQDDYDDTPFSSQDLNTWQ